MNNKKANSKRRVAKVTVYTAGLVTLLFVMFATALLLRATPKQQTLAVVGDIPPPAPTDSSPVRPLQPTPTPMGNCPANWGDSSASSSSSSDSDPATLATCEKLKASNYPQQNAAEVATMQAQPYVQVVPNFTPVTLLPMPDYAKTVRELKFDPNNGAWPFQWEGATSVWQIGAVPNKEYTSWDQLYIVAYQGNGVQASDAYAGTKAEATTDQNQNPTFATMVMTGDSSEDQYIKQWTFPKAAGEVYITRVTIPTVNITSASTPFPSLQGTVYFKAKDGETGTFDLATGVWTFDP